MITSVILAAFLCFFFYKMFARPYNFPPGPINLPFIGYLPFLTSHPFLKLWQLAKNYGDIFSINLGHSRVIILTSLDIIQETFKKDIFSGRNGFHGFLPIEEAKMGIIFGEKERWSELRRFTIRSLRDLGLGKFSLEGIIVSEIQELIKDLKKDVGQPISLTNRFNLAVVNALWTITTGERFKLDDPEAQEMICRITRMFSLTKTGEIAKWVPLLRLFPITSKNHHERMEHGRAIKQRIQEIVKKHEMSNEKSTRNDLILRFVDKLDEKNDEINSPFSRKYADVTLTATMIDLFLAGSETTSTTLLWVFLIMATFPTVQKRIQDEIDSIALGEEYPSLIHRAKFPYTEAVLMEVSRFASLIPLGIIHRSLQDTDLRGYVIPKGTLIIPNLYAVMHDPKYWERPNEFYPEHFLNPDGTLRQREAYIPFSVGKRVCLGESLARTELFLFTTHLLKIFTFSLPENHCNSTLTAEPGFFLTPKPYQVVLKLRK